MSSRAKWLTIALCAALAGASVIASGVVSGGGPGIFLVILGVLTVVSAVAFGVMVVVRQRAEPGKPIADEAGRPQDPDWREQRSAQARKLHKWSLRYLAFALIVGVCAGIIVGALKH